MSPVPAETRDRLIESARTLILKKGYQATTVAEILRESGANSGSLYYYFPTKDDLLLAVLEKYRELLWPLVIKPVFDRVSDPIERVFGVLDGYRRMLMMTECSQGCPIGNLALEVSDSHPAARRLIAENFVGWRDAIRLCLDDAVDRLPPNVDRTQLADFVLTVMEGGVMQSRAHRSLEPFESAVAMLRDYVDRLVEEASAWPKNTRRPDTPREPGAVESRSRSSSNPSGA